MMNLMKVDNNGLRCEAFVIWGWLHKLPLQSHVDHATNLRLPAMHDDCEFFTIYLSLLLLLERLAPRAVA